MGAEEVQTRSTSRTLGKILSEPVTWVPFLPIAAAYSFLDVPWLVCLAATGAVTASLIAWWRSKWSSMGAQSRLEVLKEVCRRENAEIKGSISGILSQIPASRMVSARRSDLQDLLRKKEMVEAAIFADGEVSDVEMEIAGMVSDLCRALLVDLRKLAAPQISELEQIKLAASIERALKTVERTQAEIETLIEPAHGLGGAAAATISEERASRLEERLEEAKAIRERLQRDMNPPQREEPPAAS